MTALGRWPVQIALALACVACGRIDFDPVGDEAIGGSFSYLDVKPVYLLDQPIAALYPTGAGSPTAYHRPRLPAGLRFDPRTGVIDGAPTVVQSATAYEVTAIYSTESVSTTTVTLRTADKTNADDQILHRVTAKGCEVLLRRRQAPDVSLDAKQPVAEALGSISVGGIGDAPRQRVVRVAGDKIEPVMEATIGYTNLIAGTPNVLWAHNGIELLCFDGKTSKQVPRVLHEPV